MKRKLYNKVLEKKLSKLIKSKNIKCSVTPMPIEIGGQGFFAVKIYDKRTKKEEYLYHQIREEI